MKIKLKEGIEVSTDDFWYDLTAGGYIVPEDILENPADAVKVRKAIEVIKEFKASCIEQIEGFER